MVDRSVGGGWLLGLTDDKGNMERRKKTRR